MQFSPPYYSKATFPFIIVGRVGISSIVLFPGLSEQDTLQAELFKSYPHLIYILTIIDSEVLVALLF